MEITQQNNHLECGVCVINSMVKHFYHRADKLEILNNANISNQGLSIFDLEILGQKYGLFLETFQQSWKEFCHEKSNDYYITLINKSYGNHYVIIRKHKNYISVYDSASGVYQTSYQEFKQLFSNIIICVSKTKVKFELTNLTHFNIFKSVNFYYLLINLFLQIAIIAFSTLGANYLNTIINNAIINSAITNTIVISIVFLFIYLGNNLTQYILHLYTAKAFKVNFQYLSNHLLNRLRNKNKDFLNKIDTSQFYLVDGAMQSIVLYAINDVPGLFANFLLVAVTIIVVACINSWFLIVVAICIVTLMIMNVCQYNYRQKIVNIAINNQNINSNITKNLIDYLSQQNNYLINNNLIRDLQNNYQEFLNIYCKKTKFDSAYDFVNSTFTNIIFVAIIVIGAYLVINQSQQFNIGRLTFVISLLSMMHNATNGICDFIVKQITFKKMQEIYLGVVETSNVNNTGQTKIMQIQQIHYQLHNHKRCITNGELLNKQQYKIINNLINYRNNNIYINEIPLDKIDYQDIHNKIFGINLFTKIDKKLIIEQVEKRNLLLIQIIQRFKIDIISQPSLTLTQQLLLNIGFCGGLTNNLILFDNCLSYLSVCEKKWIKKNIIPELIKNNFVLINRT